MKNSEKVLNEICQKKWKMTFDEFLKGTFNEVEADYLSKKDAIKQIKDLVLMHIGYEEDMKEVLNKVVGFTSLGEKVPDHLTHEIEELLTKIKPES